MNPAYASPRPVASTAPVTCGRCGGSTRVAVPRSGYGIAYPPIWLETLYSGRRSTGRLEATGTVFVPQACQAPPDQGLGVIRGGIWPLRDDGT